MLRLNPQKGPRWVDLGFGVRVEVDPVTTAVMSGARRAPEFKALAKALAADHPEIMSDPEAMAEVVTDSDIGDDLALAMAKAVAARIIRGWEGVADEAGAAAPVNAENIAALLDVPQIFQRFQEAVLEPAQMLESEKNASPPLLNGTSAGAVTTAVPVRRPAKPARKG